MWRLALLGLLCMALARAQFSDLATTDDGSQVFFVTPLRQRGSDQLPHEKVFALGDSGIRLLFQRERNSLYYTSPFFPSSVTASGDGLLVAFDLGALCSGGSSCIMRELSQGVVLDCGSGRETSPGPHVRISRNGRYVLWWVSPGAMGMGARSGILDRLTGRRTDFLSSTRDGAIAANGTALLVHYDSLAVARPDGGESVLISSSGIVHAAIDDTGTLAVVEKYPHRLFVLNLATGALLQPAPDSRDSYGASVSADGRWLLYISVIGETPQLFFSQVDGTRWKQLTTSDQGVSGAILSGNGRVVWAATPDGRLLKIDTAAGTTREMLAPPLLGRLEGPVVPGSLLRITGRRLGNQVKLEDRYGAVLSAMPEEVLVQVPWDMPLPPERGQMRYVITSVAREDSLFEATTPEFSVGYSTFRPSAFIAPAHEDWSGLVTPEDQARPGEIIHIYGTGLGPVDCSIQTGKAPPAGVACRPTTPIQWDYWWTATDSMPADVLFAGLAPGLVGLYQIDARVPASPPASRLKLIANRFGWNVVADFYVGSQH